MSFNVTGLNIELFYAGNSAAHLTFSLAIILPSFILCGLCVVALLLAKDIDQKMKLILINMLIPEIFGYFAGFTVDFGYPLRAFHVSKSDISCSFAFSFSIIFFLGTNVFTPFFAIVVYIFLKCDIKKSKWYGIIPFIVISWIVILTVGLLSSLHSNTSSVNGFCLSELSLSGSSLFLSIITIFLGILFVSALCTALVFSALSCYYVKNNTISNEDGTSIIKRAVAKILLFHVLKVCFTLLLYITSATIFFFRQLTEERAGIVVALFIEYAVRRFSYEITLLLTPIVFIVLLKPVRDALKELCKIRCFVRKNAAIHPSGQ